FPDGTTQTNITTQVVYTSNLTTSNGCDSIVETTVNVNPTYFNQETASVCSGGSYTFPDGTTQTNITTQVVYTSNLTTTNGCDSIIETTINVNPQLSVVADTISPICNGDNLTLTATGSGNGTITWYSDATGNNVIGTGSPFNATSQITGPGIYTFYVNETGACSSVLTAVNVVVGGVNASITATPTTGFMPLTVAFGNNSSTGATVTYTWVFGDGSATSNQNEPTHIYNNMGNYIATLIVTDGVCYDTASVVIEVVGQSTILIPNVFTPNADGSNDVFTVKGTNLESVEGEIYNRWGQKLFSWNGVKGSWDGRTEAGSECPDGTYFYIIKAKGLDGADYHKTGAFSLIR
ncbi:MAG: gliding motility-associated C-terminal domain-containing protein, partial [Flavobacteriales bacterium]|nr:gliding motility-associated C-terminal domain-containing protein [Flavobacteriales bacterium]